MAAAVIQELLNRTPNIDPAQIEDVVIGCAFPEGEQGLNMARMIALRAGLPDSVPAETINRYCASGVQSIAHVAYAIQNGQLGTAIAGGASPPALADLLLAAQTDRVYADTGHSLDFINKAFECLDLIGWEHATAVLPSVVGQMAASRGAEESTAWPMVSRPTYLGGLGFGMKWDMGWMHDTLQYLSLDPIYRKFHHTNLTFRQIYAGTENFVLPLSHDEVVHGKGSLLAKMPGDDWRQFANLRLLYGFQWAYPGKKLLFMGGEFGQTNEWYHETSLDWHLLDMGPYHRGLQRLVRDLNQLYRAEPALHQVDYDPAGFQWIDCSDWEQSVVSFVRRAKDPNELLLFACNFTPVPRVAYRVGAPRGGFWRELLNTDSAFYGGSNLGHGGGVMAEDVPAQGQPCSLALTLPPLAVVVLKPAG